jgi:predicted transcriptional regulator
MKIIKSREKKIAKTYRLRPDILERLEAIAAAEGESRTYVLESLLEYAIKAYERQHKLK